jgi:hypothetical protein
MPQAEPGTKTNEKERKYKAEHKANNEAFMPNRFVEHANSWNRTERFKDWRCMPLDEWRAKYPNERTVNARVLERSGYCIDV